ncbi:L,D-transpeptidase [Aurantimonas sp. VKM B-3413]|uniref:L,D-transpeptidase family protein n=1 Tax=Aurantimonas sp. VKM B-3413 TaxID=2779401 RepID=UPI001E35D65D|nr:L,D-transpeptidase family protein [Aurantimonas sp. VKM B-3413]MCB8837724.1 L,D-transpeptidase family protein [Aurantimonas sp. VKM B-3413]
MIVRRLPGSPSRGILAAGPLRLVCALGRSGTTVFKREGDGATPVGEMAVLSAWHRPGRMPRPQARLAIRRIREGVDGWCDAPDHASYNRHVRLPFPASAEELARADRLYDFIVVLDFNLSSRSRGRGSAIFLHVAKPGYPPTAGCIAVSPANMLRLAPLLSRRTRLVVRR